MKTIDIALNERTITLTEEEADGLRQMLQVEFLKRCINSIIDDNIECFRFESEKNRTRFVDDIARQHDDLINMWGCYEENLIETVFHFARELKLGVGI